MANSKTITFRLSGDLLDWIENKGKANNGYTTKTEIINNILEKYKDGYFDLSNYVKTSELAGIKLLIINGVKVNNMAPC